MQIEGRFRTNELIAALERNEIEQRERQRRGLIIGLLIVAALPTIGFGLDYFIFFDMAATLFGGFAAFVVFLFVLSRNAGAKKLIAKGTFGKELLHALQDDIAPSSKVTFWLDNTASDATSKRYWSGYSTHGNRKHRYEDRWLRLKFPLIDGTEIVVERRADVKTRKGGVMKHKRRLYLKIRPNEKTFGHHGDHGELLPMVKERVSEAFHDPPERLRVTSEASPGGIRIRVNQTDADILAAEVLMLIETALLYLQMRR